MRPDALVELHFRRRLEVANLAQIRAVEKRYFGDWARVKRIRVPTWTSWRIILALSAALVIILPGIAYAAEVNLRRRWARARLARLEDRMTSLLCAHASILNMPDSHCMADDYGEGARADAARADGSLS
jgi:hypothetical protein